MLWGFGAAEVFVYLVVAITLGAIGALLLLARIGEVLSDLFDDWGADR